MWSSRQSSRHLRNKDKLTTVVGENGSVLRRVTRAAAAAAATSAAAAPSPTPESPTVLTKKPKDSLAQCQLVPVVETGISELQSSGQHLSQLRSVQAPSPTPSAATASASQVTLTSEEDSTPQRARGRETGVCPRELPDNYTPGPQGPRGRGRKRNAPLRVDPKEERQRLENLRRQEEAEQLRGQKVEEDKRRRLEEAQRELGEREKALRLQKERPQRELEEKKKEEQQRLADQRLQEEQEKSQGGRGGQQKPERDRGRAVSSLYLASNDNTGHPPTHKINPDNYGMDLNSDDSPDDEAHPQLGQRHPA
ncbi:inner centromere protein [Pontoporia blainvillei]|uniref:Inner centromere protein n=1 Tax=Pontoporia blainvillei TaxID=48723 RepID=A0ABX0S229_PONBL|nr:inner centromere protein [Pontoporia blainvillei]